MTNEHTGFSRRKLLKAGAVGVPTAGLLAFGSTLVTATSANAISADGWWGSETSAGLQRFMNTVMNAGLVVDGVISSQPSGMASACPGIVGGWEWDGSYEPAGSPTIAWMNKWLGVKIEKNDYVSNAYISEGSIKALQSHYGISPDGRLDAPSQPSRLCRTKLTSGLGKLTNPQAAPGTGC